MINVSHSHTQWRSLRATITSGQVRHTHCYNSAVDGMGVITCFCVAVLASFLVSVASYPDQSNLKKEGCMWLVVQGYSPPWQQKFEVTRHIIYAVRKQRVVTYWTYWIQLTFFLSSRTQTHKMVSPTLPSIFPPPFIPSQAWSEDNLYQNNP